MCVSASRPARASTTRPTIFFTGTLQRTNPYNAASVSIRKTARLTPFCQVIAQFPGNSGWRQANQTMPVPRTINILPVTAADLQARKAGAVGDSANRRTAYAASNGAQKTAQTINLMG